jgi:glutathione peroxidase
MLRREAAQPEEARAVAMFLGGALVAAALATLLGPRGDVPWPPAPSAAWLATALALAVVFLAGNLALQYGAARLPANRTAVVMLTEVLFASASAVAFGGEALSAPLVAGGALIVAAATLSALEPEPAARPDAVGATIAVLPPARENRMAETTAAPDAPATCVYDFEALSIDGNPAHFSTQRGKVLLVVNTASACGFTPQFAGLESLWKDYASKGLVVVGFPSNQFGAQDPGSNDEIAGFCQKNYGVTFPMMAKIDVNGEQAHPLWKWLTAEARGFLGTKSIKWNFTKFLVGKDGQVIKRYAPTDTPESIRADIEAALAA